MKLFRRKLCMLLFSFAIIIQIYTIVSYATIQIDKNEISNNLTNYSNNTLSDSNKGNSTVLNSDESRVLELINSYRASNNEPAIVPISSLQTIAYAKAKDLIEYNYFSHTSPNFGSTFNLMNNQKISYNIAGENLAGNISSEKAVDAWINSPSHKKNILTSDYKYTGIAVINSDVYGKIFVQIFIG